MAAATAALLVLCGAVVAVADDTSYWDRFKTYFVDWDDDAKPGTAPTEVAGVRGVNVEQALGSDKYDWAAVLYMEEFEVSVADEKKFLQEGKLGPFQVK